MTQSESAKLRLTSATLSWFDDGCCDVIYLDIWQEMAVSFIPPAHLDKSWQKRQQQTWLGQDESGALFRHAADLLMRFQLYPNGMASQFGDFDLGDGRWLQPGDRIVQRFHVWRLWGRPLLDVVGLVEIRKVVLEPHRVGYDYVSVSPHPLEGQWSVYLTWQGNGELRLETASLSRPSAREPAHNHQRIRRWQEQLLQAGVSHFQQMVTAIRNQPRTTKGEPNE